MHNEKIIEKLENIVKDNSSKDIITEDNERILKTYYLLALAYLKERSVKKATECYVCFFKEADKMREKEIYSKNLYCNKSEHIQDITKNGEMKSLDYFEKLGRLWRKIKPDLISN
ncbi:MAG: hypothetical protein PHV16_04645 [Candidatus Nanoarchaeia archaeon]|nr:hypothetical protein [Candidatus Nanoarchaeia archaeon]